MRGTYFESCNCDAICPCRRTGGAAGGRSTHGVCDFALSWWIEQGEFDGERLDGLAAVMVGTFEDRAGFRPWRVALLLDEHASAEAQKVLASIFLGQAGGTPAANFAGAIGTVESVRPAAIRLDHRPRRERIEVESSVSVEAGDPAAPDGAVSCGIPGHDHPGTEVFAKRLEVDEAAFTWRYAGVCGFRTGFDYRSD